MASNRQEAFKKISEGDKEQLLRALNEDVPKHLARQLDEKVYAAHLEALIKAAQSDDYEVMHMYGLFNQGGNVTFKCFQSGPKGTEFSPSAYGDSVRNIALKVITACEQNTPIPLREIQKRLRIGPALDWEEPSG